MADMSNTEEKVELNLSENEENSFDFVADIFDKVRDISTLVSKARLRAKEAEIRAMYSLQFAQRAIEEAKSAHQVSESLARTSHVVAMLALEITNDTDYLIDNRYLEESINLSETENQTQVENQGENKEPMDTEILKPDSKEVEVTSKFDAVYPNDLRTDDMKHSKNATGHLPAVIEEVDNSSTDDLKRKMMLYKDSKLMKRRSQEMGDGEPVVYESQGTQTY